MGLTSWSDVSKAVGYAEQTITYPTEEQVKTAIEAKNAYKLLSWHRFLGTPECDAQSKIKALVDAGLEKIKKGMDA